MANNELIICQTDKSGKFAVLTREQYITAGNVHTCKDQDITREVSASSGLISIIESINTDISNSQEHHQRAGTSTTLDMQQPGAEEGETPIEGAADQPGDSVHPS